MYAIINLKSFIQAASNFQSTHLKSLLKKPNDLKHKQRLAPLFSTLYEISSKSIPINLSKNYLKPLINTQTTLKPTQISSSTKFHFN